MIIRRLSTHLKGGVIMRKILTIKQFLLLLLLLLLAMTVAGCANQPTPPPSTPSWNDPNSTPIPTFLAPTPSPTIPASIPFYLKPGAEVTLSDSFGHLVKVFFGHNGEKYYWSCINNTSTECIGTAYPEEGGAHYYFKFGNKAGEFAGSAIGEDGNFKIHEGWKVSGIKLPPE